MENTKNTIALVILAIGVGVIIGAYVVLNLLSSGAMPTKFTVAGVVEFAIPTPVPTILVKVVTPTPIPSPTATLPPVPTPLPKVWTEIKAVIDTETEATRNRDLESVLSLYVDNAIVIDLPAGMRWNGKNEIRSRYSDIFARYRFLENIHVVTDLKQDPPDNPINVTAKVRQRAKIQNVTNGSVADSPWTQEYWYFAKIDNAWKITRFIYSMPDWQ